MTDSVSSTSNLRPKTTDRSKEASRPSTSPPFDHILREQTRSDLVTYRAVSGSDVVTVLNGRLASLVDSLKVLSGATAASKAAQTLSHTTATDAVIDAWVRLYDARESIWHRFLGKSTTPEDEAQASASHFKNEAYTLRTLSEAALDSASAAAQGQLIQTLAMKEVLESKLKGVVEPSGPDRRALSMLRRVKKVEARCRQEFKLHRIHHPAAAG